MKCSPEQLSALLDGDLSPRVAARVRAHLETCERCRADEQALTAMRAGLASLPAPEPGADDGWLALTRKLGAQPQPARRWSWRRWVLAPAFAVVAAAAVFVYQRGHRLSDETLLSQAEAEFRGAETQYLGAIAKLERVTDHARQGWPEPRQKDYAAARAALEAATDECRKVARAQPADADAEELLFAAYRKQIRFYQEELLQ